MADADSTIREILKRYDERPGEGTTWKVQSATVITHKALERIAAKAQIVFDKPQILRAERDEAVILVNGFLAAANSQNGTQHAWSIGEALVNVNYRVSGKQAAYVYAMAEKRAKDRVILKLIGLHGLLYSEEEAEEFRSNGNREPDERAVAEASAELAEAMISGLAKRAGADAVSAFLSHQRVVADLKLLTPADRQRVEAVADERRQVAAARAAS